MRTALKIGLPVAIVLLTFFLIRGINTPIQFEKEKKIRYSEVIQNLKDIRTAQLAYKDVYGNFISSFDTLINFVKYDSMPLVRSLGSLPDTLTEKMALEMEIHISEYEELLDIVECSKAIFNFSEEDLLLDENKAYRSQAAFNFRNYDTRIPPFYTIKRVSI